MQVWSVVKVEIPHTYSDFEILTYFHYIVKNLYLRKIDLLINDADNQQFQSRKGLVELLHLFYLAFLNTKYRSKIYLTSDATFFFAKWTFESIDVVADEAPKDKQNDFLNYQLGQSNLMTTDTKNKILSTYHPLQSGVLQMKAFFELAWASFKDLV